MSRKPPHDERLQPHSEHEITGEQMLERADQLIEQDYRLTPEQRAEARAQFRGFIEALTMNAPALFLNLSEDTDRELSRAGYVTPDVWMHGRSQGDWALAFRLYEHGYSGDWAPTTIHYSMWTFLGDVRNGTHRLIVGEEAVSEWLRGRSLATVHVEESARFHFERDFNLLQRMRAGRLPIDYLALTDEQRQRMGDHMVVAILDDDYRIRNDMAVIEYLLDIHDPDERNRLYAHISEALTEELPVTHTDDTHHGRTLDVAESLAKQMTSVEGQPPGMVLRDRAKHLLLLAHLYRQRSQMVHDAPEPLPEPTRERTYGVGEEFAPDHQLNVFAQNSPDLNDIWQDIDYLNYLSDRGMSADELKLTERRALTLSTSIHRLIMDDSISLGDLRPVFTALEFAFDAQEGPERRRLYSEILYALAGSLPVKRYGSGDLERVVGVLEALLPRLPEELRNYRQDGLQGPAEVAAILADMYEWRAGFYIQADLTRTGMDQDEDPDEAAAAVTRFDSDNEPDDD